MRHGQTRLAWTEDRQKKCVCNEVCEWLLSCLKFENPRCFWMLHAASLCMKPAPFWVDSYDWCVRPPSHCYAVRGTGHQSISLKYRTHSHLRPIYIQYARLWLGNRQWVALTVTPNEKPTHLTYSNITTSSGFTALKIRSRFSQQHLSIEQKISLSVASTSIYQQEDPAAEAWNHITEFWPLLWLFWSSWQFAV